jgi:hypothetical protein
VSPGNFVSHTRGQKQGKKPLQNGCASILLTPPPCRVAAFVVNSEQHTGARPSVRLCVGPKLARCVHTSFMCTENRCLRRRDNTTAAEGHSADEQKSRVRGDVSSLLAAFVVNSEPRARARSSVRLCVGPELSRCVHYV